MIRNLLAVWGLISLLLLLFGAVAASPYYAQYRQLDPQAMDTYLDIGRKILETGDSAAATVWRVKVDEDLTADDVEEAMKDEE